MKELTEVFLLEDLTDKELEVNMETYKLAVAACKVEGSASAETRNPRAQLLYRCAFDTSIIIADLDQRCRS